MTATAALLLVIRLAALAVPSAPALVDGHAPFAGEPADASHDGPPGAERVVVAPDADDPRRANAAARDASPLATLPSALQETVRRQVWGKAWERVRDQLAQATTSGTAADRALENDAATESDDEWELARDATGAVARRHARPGTESTDASDENGATVQARPAERHPAATDETDDDHRGGGAGNGTAPDLFGPATDDGLGEPDGSFELAIAARMRAERLGERRADTIAPPADRDARPALAGDQRRESAAHRMTVPPAYEAVVREVFAHRRSDQP
jgi:hypothetical protein